MAMPGATGNERPLVARSVVIRGPAGDRAFVRQDDDDLTDAGSPAMAEFRQLFDVVAFLFPECRSTSERAPPPSFLYEGSGQVQEPQAPSSYRCTLYDRLVRIKEDMTARSG